MTAYIDSRTEDPPDYPDEPEPADPESESLWNSAPPERGINVYFEGGTCHIRAGDGVPVEDVLAFTDALKKALKATAKSIGQDLDFKITRLHYDERPENDLEKIAARADWLGRPEDEGR